MKKIALREIIPAIAETATTARPSIFIACHDNLKGLEEAIHAVYPKTKQQLCIVHQIRNSTKFVQYKDQKEICADLKKIYGAVNLDDAVPRPLRFMRFWLTDERKNGRPFLSTVHRISRSKRRVAPQRCPNDATTKSLTEH